MYQKQMGVLVALVLSASMLGGSAIVEKGTDVFTFEGELYFDCFGEMIWTELEAPYTYRLIQKPNGDYTYIETWDSKAYYGIIIGLETGRVWDRTKTVTTLTQHGDGSWGYSFKSVFVERGTGKRTMVHEKVRVSYNGNGEMKVDRYEFDCKPIGMKN